MNVYRVYKNIKKYGVYANMWDMKSWMVAFPRGHKNHTKMKQEIFTIAQ